MGCLLGEERVIISQGPQHEKSDNASLFPLAHLKPPEHRIGHRENRYITNHIRDGEPEHRPFRSDAGMSPVGIRTAYEGFDEKEGDAPRSDESDENIVDEPKGRSGEDSSVEE